MYYCNKARIYLLTKKIYRFIDDHGDSLNFVKIPNQKRGNKNIQNRGYYWEEDERIDLDYRYEIIPTLIHECIHHYHPEWEERRVEKEERMVMALLSKKQAINILRAMAAGMTA